MRKNESIISNSYLNLTAASSQYQDNWICELPLPPTAPLLLPLLTLTPLR